MGDPLPGPAYAGFMPSPHEHPPVRSRSRDEHVRSVSRATRAIAALAVLGTAIFGGLAAASARTSSPATTAGSATTAATSTVAGSSSSSQSSGKSASLAAPAAAPTPAASAQPPVASSGGS